MFVAGPVFSDLVGTLLCGSISEQQSVRHVFAAPRRQILLPEAFRPADPGQRWPDQVVFGLALVRCKARGEAVKYATQIGLKFVDLDVLNGRPIGKLFDRLAKEILGEQASLEVSPSRHAWSWLFRHFFRLRRPVPRHSVSLSASRRARTNSRSDRRFRYFSDSGFSPPSSSCRAHSERSARRHTARAK